MGKESKMIGYTENWKGQPMVEVDSWSCTEEAEVVVEAESEVVAEAESEAVVGPTGRHNCQTLSDLGVQGTAEGHRVTLVHLGKWAPDVLLDYRMTEA